MQMTIYDRDVLRQVIASHPTGEQAVSWLTEVLKVADTGKNFRLPFPSFFTNNHRETTSTAETRPKSEVKEEPKEAVEQTDEERYVSRALKWADRQEFAFAFRRDVSAKERSVCRFGSHRIEQGDEIAKLGAMGKRGDVLNLWGCIPCFEAIIDEFGIEVED